MNKLHRAHEEEFSKRVNGYKVGDTISIRRPADFTVRSGATLSAQDVIEGKTTLTIDQQVGVDFQFTSSDLTLKITDLSERVMKPAMSNIINYMANDVLTTMYKGSTIGSVRPARPSTRSPTSRRARSGSMRWRFRWNPCDRGAILSPADHWALLGSRDLAVHAGPARKGGLSQRLARQDRRHRHAHEPGRADAYHRTAPPTTRHATGQRRDAKRQLRHREEHLDAEPHHRRLDRRCCRARQGGRRVHVVRGRTIAAKV